RVEALTGETARHHLEEQGRRLRSIAGALRVPADEAESRVAALVEERRRLERELADARRALAMGAGGEGEAARPASANGVPVLLRVLRDISPKDLKPLVDEGKKKIGSGVVAFIAL